MLQRFREILAIVLLALLPLHALLVTVSTLVLSGPGQAPMGSIAIWKEALLGLILLCAVLEVLVRRMDGVRSFFRFDVLDWLIVALLAVAIIVTAMNGFEPRSFALGLRYDFVPLVTFFVVRRLPWSAAFRFRAVHFILAIALLVSVYGLATMILPQSFFSALGYSDLHSLYLPSGPVAAFQQIGSMGIRRVQSTMSGPNQLGMWLLLPFAIAGLSALRRSGKARIGALLLTGIFGIAILVTFSRAAWVAAALAAVVGTVQVVGSASRSRVLAALTGAVLLIGISGVLLFPQVLLRSASTLDHIERPLAAVDRIKEHPFGSGLGAAGPAQNKLADACVHLEAGADASWAVDRPDLCVFVGGAQVQPEDRVCVCPFLPENWYLQIGVELGAIGMALFITFVGLLLHALYRKSTQGLYPHAVFLAMLGVSVAALVLHAWEDSAVAYTYFLLSAVVIGGAPRASRS